MDVGASLLVVNHFNQTGGGSSLKRITMAGSGEWADSWVLLEHREKPDVAVGVFALSVEIGSRQWGGSVWDLDLDIGRFDEDTGTHDGEITWDLRRATPPDSIKRMSAVERQRLNILDTLADEPWRLTKTGVKEIVKGDRTAFAVAFDELAAEGRITHDKVGRAEAGTTKGRLLWGVSAE